MNRTGSTTRDRVGRSRRAPERRPAPGVTPLARRRPRPRRRNRRPVQLAVASTGLIAVVWLLLVSPVLGVTSVQVDGVRTLPADQVRRTAGIAAGTPLLRVDVDAARARIARLPQVASVAVTRGWPHTVVVTVHERVPVAVVGEPGRRTLVDAQGVLFDTVSGAPPAGVVALDVATPGPRDPATRAGLTTVQALPADLRTLVASVAAAPTGEITLTLTDGKVVRWGGPEQSRRKATALAALLKQLGDGGGLERASTIDVSTPQDVVLR